MEMEESTTCKGLKCGQSMSTGPDPLDAGNTNANRAIAVLLVRPRPDGHAPISQCRPAFTYSIFGEKQVIFGYQHLSIVIRFAAFDLHPHLELRFSAVHSSVEEGGPLDVRHTLREWLPPGTFGLRWTLD